MSNRLKALGSGVAEMKTWCQVTLMGTEAGVGQNEGGRGAGVGNTCLYREEGEKHRILERTPRGAAGR